MMVVDHLLWAVPDLNEGSRLFENLAGVPPVAGGSHPGGGTRNALVSLGDGIYLELIAPDPAQSLEGNLGGRIAAMPRPGLIKYALASDDLPAACEKARGAGLVVEAPVAMNRMRPDGVRLDWEILFLSKDPWLGQLPFLINWKGSSHPSGSAPGGCTLKSFVRLEHEPDPPSELHRKIGIPVAVRRADRCGYLAALNTPRGEVMLTSL